MNIIKNLFNQAKKIENLMKENKRLNAIVRYQRNKVKK